MSGIAYKFELPKHHQSIIKVIGVGGGGSNAVNHMYGQGIKDVEFVVCNTDLQALNSSPIPYKLQIGANLTEGLGCGANPEVGRAAAMESKDQIREMLAGTKMIFVTPWALLLSRSYLKERKNWHWLKLELRHCVQVVIQSW